MKCLLTPHQPETSKRDSNKGEAKAKGQSFVANLLKEQRKRKEKEERKKKKRKKKAKKLTLDISVGGLVGGLDVLGLLSPDDGVSLGLPEPLALLIDVIVDIDGEDPGEEEENSLLGANVDGVGDEEEGAVGVEGGKPVEAAPANVKPEAVVHDVNGIEIAGLPPEELGNVDQLHPDRDVHGVGDLAVQLLLLQEVAEQQDGPSHHASAEREREKKNEQERKREKEREREG